MIVNIVVDMPTWEEAKCIEMPLDYFFPETNKELSARLPELVAACSSCIHRSACLTYALDNQLKDGVFGGLTPNQRKGLQRKGRARSVNEDRLPIVIKRVKAGMRIPEIADSMCIQQNQVDRVIALAKQTGLL